MRLDYIDEAFKKLELLNEETFNFSPKAMGNLDSFLDEDDTAELVKVIDPDANKPEDLKTSYVGKVITNCTVCHSNIFVDKNDIVIDEEGVVNSESQCPYCGEFEGFTLLGEIVPYDPNPSDHEDVEVEVDGEAVSETGDGTEEGSDSEPAEETLEESFEGHLTNREKLKRRFPELQFADEFTAEPLEESMNNVNVETDDTIVTIESDDDGKVTVSTEPKNSEEATPETSEPSETGDMIAPLSDDTLADIESNNSEGEEVPAEDTTEEAEVPTEGEDTTTAEASEGEEPEEVDVDLEEVDEEGLDNLGESYFKKVYENVNSYKTTAVYMPNDKLIVEGLLTFKSGTSKKTGFVFNATGADGSGKILFEGYNPQLSRGKKAFSLLGRMEGSKFLPESLGYDYRARNVKNCEERVSGKIIR